MIDVGAKGVTRRRAVAVCRVSMRPETLEAITAGRIAKGDVLAVAQVAAVLAAKRTPDLIPGCHPLRLSAVEVAFSPAPPVELGVRVEVRGEDRTGFEMEALTACAVAALTVYDMCKGIDPDITVSDLRLEAKEGGKSSVATSLDGVTAAVLTVSDGVAKGEREDRSGAVAREWLEARGARVAEAVVVPDEREEIGATIRSLAESASLVVTSGGTGVGPRDVTPEATQDVADRLVPGLGEQMRRVSLRVTPNAMLSRGVAVTIGTTLVVNLPGSPAAVTETLDAIAPALAHAIELLAGERPH